jgi:TRAP-type C4-dicarboxylate transport system substrate-binding protein
MALVVGAGIPSANAKEYKLTMGSSHPPIVPWVATLKNYVVPESNKMLKAMGSPDSIKWTEAYAGALYNFENTLEGVGQGLADVGWVGTLWEGVKMPLQNVTYYAPFVNGDVFLLKKIQQEMETNIPAMKQAWEKQNVVYLGPQVADTYHIITTKPVRTFEDLKGLKLQGGGVISTWLQNTGAVAVGGGLPIMYNNIKTGVVDGAVIITTGMFPFKLHEVAKYITKVNIGAVISGAMAMNKDTWDSLTPEMQKLFLDLGEGYGDRQTDIVAGNVEKFLGLMKKDGVEVIDFPEAERQKWVDALPNLAGDWVKANGPAAKEVLTYFMDAARKNGAKPLRAWDKGL